MKIMSLTEKKEDAVSPVIGVMLMLVVTIVIAAVVAAFAGGLGSDVEMAPTAALNIDVYSDGDIKVEHLSGEALVTNEISIKVTDTNGGLLVSKNLKDGYNGLSFAPGTTTVVASGVELNKGDLVTVTVFANEKHIIAKKDLLIKA